MERAAAAAGLDQLGTTTQAEYLVGLGTESLLQAIQADPATTIEAYLAVRSALMRLLDPSAMGRFRVMAFGRAWPAGRATGGLRLPPPPRRPASASRIAAGGLAGTAPDRLRPLHIARRNRAIYLLLARGAGSHDSPRSGTT